MTLTPSRIRRIRKRLRLTMRQAGERCCVSEAAWSYYESGQRNPGKAVQKLMRDLDTVKVPR